MKGRIKNMSCGCETFQIHLPSYSVLLFPACVPLDAITDPRLFPELKNKLVRFRLHLLPDNLWQLVQHHRTISTFRRSVQLISPYLMSVKSCRTIVSACACSISCDLRGISGQTASLTNLYKPIYEARQRECTRNIH